MKTKTLLFLSAGGQVAQFVLAPSKWATRPARRVVAQMTAHGIDQANVDTLQERG